MTRRNRQKGSAEIRKFIFSLLIFSLLIFSLLIFSLRFFSLIFSLRFFSLIFLSFLCASFTLSSHQGYFQAKALSHSRSPDSFLDSYREGSCRDAETSQVWIMISSIGREEIRKFIFSLLSRHSYETYLFSSLLSLRGARHSLGSSFTLSSFHLSSFIWKAKAAFGGFAVLKISFSNNHRLVR